MAFKEDKTEGKSIYTLTVPQTILIDNEMRKENFFIVEHGPFSICIAPWTSDWGVTIVFVPEQIGQTIEIIPPPDLQFNCRKLNANDTDRVVKCSVRGSGEMPTHTNFILSFRYTCKSSYKTRKNIY